MRPGCGELLTSGCAVLALVLALVAALVFFGEHGPGTLDALPAPEPEATFEVESDGALLVAVHEASTGVGWTWATSGPPRVCGVDLDGRLLGRRDLPRPGWSGGWREFLDLGDVDGDGLSDAALSTHDLSVIVGGPDARDLGTLGAVLGTVSPAGDLDGDGVTDVFHAPTGDGRPCRLRAVSFASGAPRLLGEWEVGGFRGVACRLDDRDGDGLDDLLLLTGGALEGDLGVWSPGAGRVITERSVDWPEDDWVILGIEGALLADDLDGDGLREVVLVGETRATEDCVLAYDLARGETRWTWRGGVSCDSSDGCADRRVRRLADVDGDGFDDVLFVASIPGRSASGLLRVDLLSGATGRWLAGFEGVGDVGFEAVAVASDAPVRLALSLRDLPRALEGGHVVVHRLDALLPELFAR